MQELILFIIFVGLLGALALFIDYKHQLLNESFLQFADDFADEIHERITKELLALRNANTPSQLAPLPPPAPQPSTASPESPPLPPIAS